MADYKTARDGLVSLSNMAVVANLQADNILEMKSINNDQCEKFQEIVETQIGMLENLQTNLTSAYERCLESYSGEYTEQYNEDQKHHQPLMNQIGSYIERLTKLQKALDGHMKENNIGASKEGVNQTEVNQDA